MRFSTQAQRRTSAAVVAAVVALLVGGVVASATQKADRSVAVSLADAPWAVQPDGSPRLDAVGLRPSLRFAPGVSYAEALHDLYVAARTTGVVPPGTIVEDPLPAEVVYVAPASSLGGIRLSLTAPWGWTPDERRIRPASVGLPGELAPEEATRRFAEARSGLNPIPRDGWVDVPKLADCQIAEATPENRPACP